MGGTAFAFRVGTDEQMAKPPDAYPHSCGVDIAGQQTAHSSRHGTHTQQVARHRTTPRGAFWGQKDENALSMVVLCDLNVQK
ncbi:hypothetical protein niasHT_030004 [Heterodera trifolii]|uniref:Uncharacterized protein n=1 Tax=Heterodera trifolii TaxID=157864 RepID=A0ABD2JJH9_9BILA